MNPLERGTSASRSLTFLGATLSTLNLRMVAVTMCGAVTCLARAGPTMGAGNEIVAGPFNRRRKMLPGTEIEVLMVEFGAVSHPLADYLQLLMARAA